VDFSTVIFLVAGIALFFLIPRLRKRKQIFVTDYQRGVRFVDGRFADLLGPGSYRYLTTREQITMVDMRPHQIILERLFFTDSLRVESIISIGSELLVSDPFVALSAQKDPVNDSLAMIRNALRTFVSQRITSPDAADRSKLADAITAHLNAELARFGMRVSNLEVTELGSRTAQPKPGLAPN
jgi:hypothetical protein